MRSLQLLALALLATAARADTIFIEGQIDTALTFCDMEDNRCPPLGTPSGLGGIIATNLWGNWSRTVDSSATTFNYLDNPSLGFSVGTDFIWSWDRDVDGYSWNLYFPANTFPGLNGAGIPHGSLVRPLMQFGFLEYEVTGGFVSMRTIIEPRPETLPAPEPATFLLLLPALALTALIRCRSIGLQSAPSCDPPRKLVARALKS